jgi:hypothetical protein
METHGGIGDWQFAFFSSNVNSKKQKFLRKHTFFSSIGATFTNVSLFRSGKYNLLRCVYGHSKSMHHVHLLRFAAMHVIFCSFVFFFV